MKKGTWKIMAEMPKIWPETSTHRSKNRVNAQEKHKENHAKHGIITLLKIKDKEKILKAARVKGGRNRLKAEGFSSGAGVQGNTGAHFFRDLCPGMTPFRNEGEMEAFSVAGNGKSLSLTGMATENSLQRNEMTSKGILDIREEEHGIKRTG